MAEKKPITVYLADDHEVVAKAIAGLLMSVNGISRVTTFSDGKALFSACQAAWPDLVILDLEMPGWNGIYTLEKLKEVNSIPVILLTMNDEKAVIEEAFKKGALGYLNKNCTVEELEAAITSVMNGVLFLSEEIKKVMVGIKAAPVNSTALSEPITDKELEVLQLICEGLSSKEIGEKLFLSPRTVETRKQSLMDKFNVRTTGKLIVSAIKNKIIR